MRAGGGPLRSQAGVQGFTLVELLIAITLFGLVLVVLFGTLSLSGRAWDAAQTRSDTLTEQRVIHSFLRRCVNQARLVGIANKDGEIQPIFVGEPQELRWVAPLAENFQTGGLHVLDLDLVEVEGRQALRFRWRPYRPDGGVEVVDSKAQRLLVANVEEAELDYFGTTVPGEDPQWQSRWEDVSRLPLLVRLRLRAGGVQWPELIAALPQQG